MQAVGFREFVRASAAPLGLTGFVRNGDDSRTVEVIAEGGEHELMELVEALRRGPRFAAVDGVNFTLDEATAAFSRFSVEM